MLTRQRFRTYLALALALSTPAVARAQEMAAPIPNGTAASAAFGFLRFEHETAPAVGLKLTALRQRGLGLDFSIQLLPLYVPMGALVLAPDLGVAYDVSLPGAAFLLQGGGSLLVIASGDGSGALGGGYLGAAMIVRGGRRSMIRVDIKRHFMLSPYGDQVGGISASIGIGAVPAAP